MPDNAEDLYEAATSAGKILSNTNFSICALGDTGYDLFCQSGKDWDKTMEDMGGSRIYDRVDCDVHFEDQAEQWMNGTMPKLACVDDSGTFQADLHDNMVSYASGAVVDVEESENIVAESAGTSGYQAMSTASLFFHKPNKWLKRVKEAVDDDELPTTGIEKAKDMFKELRKITLKSLPQGKDYIALVDNEKCIGCTQCVYYCNFASIDMISWDLKARTSQFESKKALILDDTCVGCTLCAFACPVEAITMESKV
jgi:ferredoxin